MRGCFPRINSIATVVPPNRIAQDDAREFSARLWSVRRDDRRLGVFGNAGIDWRYICEDVSWYQRRAHGFEERNRAYLDHALALLEKAAIKSLQSARLEPRDIDLIVTVSTTGIATPSLDARLMEKLPFRRNVGRLPVFGLGCAGGVMGLARAAQCAQAQPHSRVLFLGVELNTLSFSPTDMSKRNLIAAALFSDGAAAAVLTHGGQGPALTSWGEYTWPDSLDVMGWDVGDDGLGLLMSSSIPSIVKSRLRSVAEGFLASAGLALDDIDDFCCHPGGAKVLDAIEDAFGLSKGGLVQSRAVLREFGNMSSVTVLFVLERALREAKAKRRLVTSLGPGFTAAFAILESD